jgi:hypothetical protein
MAYISHSHSHGELRRRTSSLSPAMGSALLARCAFVAAATAIVVLGLSSVTLGPSQQTPAAAKSDRLTAPRSAPVTVAVAGDASMIGGVEVRRDASGAVVYTHDAAHQTTAVARGATIPLAAGSPMNASAK